MPLKINLCEICGSNQGTFSAILGENYYKSVCQNCKDKRNIVSSGHARWNRSIDLEDHEHEIQQPYNADGTINVRFAKLYPKQAQKLFTPEQLRQAEL